MLFELFVFVVPAVVVSLLALFWYYGPRKHPSIETFPRFDWLTGNLSYFDKNVHRVHDSLYEVIAAETPNAKVIAQILPRFGHAPTNIYLLDPKLIEYVFETQFESFGKSNVVHDFMEEIFGDGIFSVDPPKWKFHRKVASRMFSLRNLKDYMFSCALRNCDNLISKMKEISNADSQDSGSVDRCGDGVIDIYDLLGRFTLDCFIESAFGESLNSIGKAPKPHEFGNAFDKLTELCDLRFLDPFWKIKRYLKLGNVEAKEIPYCVKVIDTTIYDIIASRKDQNLTDETGTQKHDLLSLFMSNRKKIAGEDGDGEVNDKKIRDITLNFVTAARDTTRILLAWFLYVINLPQNNGMRDRVVKEIMEHRGDPLDYDSVVAAGLTKTEANKDKGAHNGKGKRYRYDYLEACLLETLRLYPPVPWLQRYALRDHVLPVTYTDEATGKEYTKTHQLKKGTGVSVHTWTNGRLKSIWGETALQFDPKRFYDSNDSGVEYYSGIHRFSNYKYPAFNVQPRICLGRHLALMQAKTLIVKLFRQFDIRLWDYKNQNITYNVSIVLQMKEGLKIQIADRD